MKYYCNPINVPYRYQFNQDYNNPEGELHIDREAADPSMICFKGIYYIFPSMTKGCWKSTDMANWELCRLPDNLPFYDYAPDVRVMGDYVYFCASSHDYNCSHFRTKDVLNGPYEEI
ncbi:MAG: 1,4-beta-xylanase, partial [Pseudobutyrivibrio sp.]|nr:1,4-beta-xylanase [Pseudobutyrivibrio sp.]